MWGPPEMDFFKGVEVDDACLGPWAVRIVGGTDTPILLCNMILDLKASNFDGILTVDLVGLNLTMIIG